MNAPQNYTTAIIGGGPAGLFAAQTLASAGVQVHLFERMPSVGRKFLVAGSSGLNLTNNLPPAEFPGRYTGPHKFWTTLLRNFSPADLRSWSLELGISTYVGTSGKVFPEGQQAAPLLRRWVTLLRSKGVVFHTRHRWMGIAPMSEGWCLSFENPAGLSQTYDAKTVLFALGGGSWPQTGSDGRWVELLRARGIGIAPLTPANSGFNVNWPGSIVDTAAGLPLKNIAANSGGKTCLGECLITKTGIEGGVIYHLGPELRMHGKLSLDLKPSSTVDSLIGKLRKPKGALLSTARRRWNLSEAAAALLASRGPWKEPEALAQAAKSFEIQVTGSRPLEEAISSAGGVIWDELNNELMLSKMPGVFVAGEMIDWEAPTGGFLLQGAFATGRHAALGILRRLQQAKIE